MRWIGCDFHGKGDNSLASTTALTDDSVSATQVIVLLYGSAGELDWMAPIISYLSGIGFEVTIIYRTRRVLRSVKENEFLRELLMADDLNVKQIETGGLFSEFLDRFSHKLFRAYVKIDFLRYPVIKYINITIDKLFKFRFFVKLPKSIRLFPKGRHIIISEFPSVKRPESVWLSRGLSNSLFLYCPHSPHIYSEHLDVESDIVEGDLSLGSRFLLLGDPSDASVLQQSYDFGGLQYCFLGHPKYSKQWLHEFYAASTEYRLNNQGSEKTKILVISRGGGSYLSESAHRALVKDVFDVVNETFPLFELIVKKHPREISSYWDVLAVDNDSITISNRHVLQLASEVDFAISFWSSAAMDCYAIEVPVVEFFDPNEWQKQQIPKGEGYTTIYRELGLVRPANNKAELAVQLRDLVDSNFSEVLTEPHPRYQKLVDRSSNWRSKLDTLLAGHGINVA